MTEREFQVSFKVKTDAKGFKSYGASGNLVATVATSGADIWAPPGAEIKEITQAPVGAVLRKAKQPHFVWVKTKAGWVVVNLDEGGSEILVVTDRELDGDYNDASSAWVRL